MSLSRQSILFNPNLPDEDRGSVIVALLTTCMVLISVATLTRIGSKLAFKIKFTIEDYMIIVSLVLNIAGNALDYKIVHAGFGRHLQFLTVDQERVVRRIFQYNILFACLSLWSTKISICFFILAIIRGTHRYLRFVTYGLIIITTMASFCQLMVWGLQARPLEKLWKPEVPGTVASMKQLINTIIAITAINSTTDLFYALAPIYFLARVQMSRKRKLLILGLTGSGFLVFLTSMIRLLYVNDLKNPDLSWALFRIYICTIIGRNLAAVVADLPAIAVLVSSLHSRVTLNNLPSTDRDDGILTRGNPSRVYSKYRRRSINRHDNHLRKYGYQDIDDILLLEDQMHRPEPALTVGKNSIEVDTGIDVRTGHISGIFELGTN